ncbi:cysteine proteinase [Saitoella complicata NRRL Y-17804]|uniref:cysteine proteinase n=1 Tax=Saitoella complicata (strain BCRC 22490 / CBS 7301 / JCM 7358 / NBRC 10748 / NRRL Y-17804) TaxID=698492 RepID=UPI0008676288|nr:cysteine proteinase [Saitoella complicata NRRL Y-17804]ODQ51378.1 cysteine proteinase [Saitoella complicata NRRL Y-17804]
MPASQSAHHEATAEYHVALGQNTASTPSVRVKSYAAAVDAYLKAIQATEQADKVEKQRLRSLAKSCIEDAERIKQESNDHISSAPPSPKENGDSRRNQQRTEHTPPAPLPEIDTLQTRQQTILLRSAKINGGVYPPWTTEPKETEFTGDEPYVDPLPLPGPSSDFEWRRPTDVWDNVTVIDKSYTGVDLVQDVISDCSVVSALCVIGLHEAIHGQLIALNRIWPHGRSANGKYIVKLFFNGWERRVAIDDLLPFSSSGKPTYATSATDPSLLAPALLEKAYLKIMGYGYVFPGSNSATDIYALTSWVPEHISLRRLNVKSDDRWTSLYKAWQRGNVLVTLGTGKMSAEDERRLGIVGDHCYAVVDMREAGGRRHVLVKNPWIHHESGTVHTNEWTEELREALPEPSRGMFWMDWDMLPRYFIGLNLNWNPCLHPYRRDVHFTVDVTDRDHYIDNQQYVLRNDTGSTQSVFVLLSRHYLSKDDPTGDIALQVFDMDGKKVYGMARPLKTTSYQDTLETSLRLNIPSRKSYTIIPTYKRFPVGHRCSFTLSAFSVTELSEFMEARDRYPLSVERAGEWTKRTSGGRNTPNINPQYSLRLDCSGDLLLCLSAEEGCGPVHVAVVWGGGKRVERISRREILADSGEFTPKNTIVQIPDVPAGTYTVILSTFDAGRVGKCTLLVKSNMAVSVEPVHDSWAGKMNRTIEGGWNGSATVQRHSVNVARLTSARSSLPV